MREVLGLVRHPAFRILLTAHTVSVIGTALSPIALTYGVLTLSGSKATLGLVLAAGTVPMVVFLILGGVWADRLPRHRLMFAADIVRALTQAAVGLLMLTGRIDLWPVMALEFVRGTATALYYPAASGLTPMLVRPAKLQQANAVLSMANSLSGTLGPLAAVALVVTVGPGWALIADSGTYAVSAILLARLRPSAQPPSDARVSFAARLRAGLREVTGREWVWVSIGGFAVTHLAMGVFFVLGPSLTGTSTRGIMSWGVVVAALGVGQVIGDFTVLRIRPARPLLVAKIAETLPAGLVLAVAVHAPWPVVLGAAVFAGVGLSLPDALWFTALQQNLAGDVVSRVSSYDWLGSLALRPVGYAVAGGLAAGLGDTSTLVIAAVLVLATRMVAVAMPGVRAIRGRYEDDPAAQEATAGLQGRAT